LNAFCSIRDNIDPDSNIIEESDPQPLKHALLKDSTDARTISSIKTAPLNASFSIRDNLETDSNIPEESDLHFEKQISLNTSTDEGNKHVNQAKFSEVPLFQFVTILILIQM
jgi:hypothetical protein